MSGVTNRFTEEHQIGQAIYPQALVPGTQDTPWYSMADYHRACAILSVGDMAPGATATLSLRQATDTAGAGSKAITGKTATQLTDVDDNKVVVIELEASELDVTNGFDCIQARLITGGDWVTASLLLLRFEPRFEPVSNAVLEEIVT